MKIGFNPGSIVDASGVPLQGRVLVFIHDSLEKKSIYTLQGSEYVASENPVLLDTTGRIPTTLFFDVGVVDVLVQRYIGEPGQMSDASPDADFEDFDRFEAGFDFDPSQAGTTEVDTIADLKDIENPSGVVRVNCYTTPGDTFPRYYLWNPNCTATEDGGCVIADTHDASGMWCYLCDGDCIKSSVYGIKPGTDETNIGAFCNAPFGVSGDYVVTYPVTLYIESGTYSSIYSYYVVECRKVVFSCKAKFTQSTFYLDDFDVDGRNTDYIANFYVYNGHRRKSLAVHSSWFRDAFYLWGGFGVIYLESDNYFENNSFSSSVLIHDSTIIGNNAHYQPTFTSDGHLRFENCTFVGSELFQHYGFKAIFNGCNFSDKLFYSMNYNNVDFGLLSQGHSLQVDSWQITDALNADVWLAWANAKGITIADLCGRAVTTLYNSNIQEFRNGVFIGGTVSTNVNVKFTDIGGSVTVYPTSSGKSLTLEHCNNVDIASDTPFSSVVARDSNVVVSNGIDSSITSYSHDGGSVQATFKCAGWNANSGTHVKGKEISLRNLVASIGNFSWFDNVSMKGCTINNPVHVIPALNGSNLLSFVCQFIDNEFGNNGSIVFADSSVGNADIHNARIDQMEILDNVFHTSGYGITMPYYAADALNYYLEVGQAANSSYKGNVGSCLMESIEYGPVDMQNMYSSFEDKYISAAVYRVWNTEKSTSFTYGSALVISADYSHSKFIKPILVHQRYVEPSGDQFSVYVGVYATDYVATSSIKTFDK